MLVWVNGKEIEQVSSFKYLSESGRFKEEIKASVASARKQFFAIIEEG